MELFIYNQALICIGVIDTFETLIWRRRFFMADDFSFEIVKNIGIVSEGKGGWNLELNLVSWSGRPAKYDLRSWSPDHQKMGKGSTFSKEELTALKNLLNNVNLE